MADSENLLGFTMALAFFQRRSFVITHLFRLSAYCNTRNGTLLVSVPLGVATVTKPVVAPGGTVAFIKVSDTTVKLAGIPLSETLVVPVSPWPRMPPV